MGYLPKYATIEQACAWLNSQTDSTWVLPRLLESGSNPWFWLDFNPAYPELSGGRQEGHMARMVSHGDLQRLEADGTALVTMFSAHDGSIVKTPVGFGVPLSDLRFARADIVRLAGVDAEPQPAQIAPVVDRTRLATPAELVAAFGPSTGMDRSWFAKLDDAPRLKDARRIVGKSGRGGWEPLFCPYTVMAWLIAPKRKKGRALNAGRGWGLLERSFPKVYNDMSTGDPRTE